MLANLAREKGGRYGGGMVVGVRDVNSRFALGIFAKRREMELRTDIIFETCGCIITPKKSTVLISSVITEPCLQCNSPTHARTAATRLVAALRTSSRR